MESRAAVKKSDNLCRTVSAEMTEKALDSQGLFCKVPRNCRVPLGNHGERKNLRGGDLVQRVEQGLLLQGGEPHQEP